MKLTPQVIGAASMDAGNRSMRKAGRTAWNEEDREAAYQVNAKLWRIHDAEHDITPPPESERGGGSGGTGEGPANVPGKPVSGA